MSSGNPKDPTVDPKRPPVRPFLRWAGSKRRLLPKILPRLPTKYDRYVEPFLGGGSLFFALRPEKAVLSDLNRDLIRAYRAVRDDVEQVIEALRTFKYSKAEYYRARDDLVPADRWERAARFIFLNKTCWNGLYRENLKGHFNVPFGKTGGKNFLNADELRAASGALRGAKLFCQDFKETLSTIRRNDFVYLDPPYVTSHTSNGFIEYNSRLFKWEDQVLLANECVRITKIGAKFLMTNGAHESVDALYHVFARRHIRRASTIAGDSKYRKRCEEAIIAGGYRWPKL